MFCAHIPTKPAHLQSYFIALIITREELGPPYDLKSLEHFLLATNSSCYMARELCLYFPCQSAHLFQVKQSLLLSCEKIPLSPPKEAMTP